jgi:hypothetical protein
VTGPEHYLEAEKLIGSADDWMDADAGWKSHLSPAEWLVRKEADLACARVHATLALAAATAMSGRDPARVWAAWSDAIDPRPTPGWASSETGERLLSEPRGDETLSFPRLALEVIQ